MNRPEDFDRSPAAPRSIPADEARSEAGQSKPVIIRPETRWGPVVCWLGFLLLLPLGIWTGVGIYRGVVYDHDYKVLIAGVFPLLTLLFLYGAVDATLTARRYGRSALALDSSPCFVGDRLTGTLMVEGPLEDLKKLVLTWECTRRRTTGSKGKRRTRSQTLWESEQRISPQIVFGQNQMQVPIDVAIPADCRGVDESREDDRIVWTLQVEGEREGFDFTLNFEGLAVFKYKPGQQIADSS